MVDVFQTTNPDVIAYMQEFKLPESLFKKIFFALRKNPDNSCMIVLADNATLVGFLFGFDQVFEDYVWIEHAQVFDREVVEKEHVEKAFDMFIEFTKELGKHKIRTSSKRAKALLRKYDFFDVTTIIEKEI